MRIGAWILVFLVAVSLGSAFGQADPATITTWKFAVLCDTRGDNESTLRKSCIHDVVLRAIAEDIAADSECDLVIVPGDLVNGWWANGATDYTEQFVNWRHAMGPVYGAGISVYPIRGNHENCSSSLPPYPLADPALLQAYLDVFGLDVPQNGPAREESLTYYVEHKNALFIGLDEYITPHRVNQAWLDQVLNDNAKPFVFIYGHEPAFRVCHSDCLGTYAAERDAFWASLQEHDVVAYFCGHDHLTCTWTDSAATPPYQILLGAGGAPFISNDKYNNPAECIFPWVRTGYYSDNSGYTYAMVTVAESGVEIVLKKWDGPGTTLWRPVLTLSYSPPLP